MPKVLWPKKAGPQKVWPLTPQEVNARHREAAAKAISEMKAAADLVTITAAASPPPFSGGHSG